MTEAGDITLSQVRAGDELPVLEHDVTATTVVLGAMASRDWRPMHHDVQFARERNGVRDIFLNTPTQSAWFERFITDWAGPKARIGYVQFRMKNSVFPGDRMRIAGTVEEVLTDDTGCGWAVLAIELRAGEQVATGCRAAVALPVDKADNPWRRRGEQWRPAAVVGVELPADEEG